MVRPDEIEADLEDLNQQVALLTEGSARLENEHDILVIEKVCRQSLWNRKEFSHFRNANLQACDVLLHGNWQDVLNIEKLWRKAVENHHEVSQFGHITL